MRGSYAKWKAESVPMGAKATASVRTPSKPRRCSLDVEDGQSPTRLGSVSMDRKKDTKAAGGRKQKRCI
ncbi:MULTISPECIES: hypothetical protein [Acidithrix]|uniref:hypothetical protein n=1 Tax=Acidithrix TaxID=1609233 RepID=UPI000695DFBA|nr:MULTISPECIES: hypothetical protein [Acidithrix]